jgi:NitT/TauT family transport system ATP-binding protein
VEKAVQESGEDIGVKMRILDVIDVGFNYGETLQVIDTASFYCNTREFVSIIGPSGCGKSTLLRIIAGLVEPAHGKILFTGKRVTRPTEGISFVFQDFALMPWLTNLENVKLGLAMKRMPEKEKEKISLELLESFGLSDFEDAYPNMLSGGMKQRVGIARAIASKPKLLLMDEPFSALDELTAEALRKEVVDLLKSKKSPIDSVVMVTHNVEEAVELSDRVVVLSDKPSMVKDIVKIELKRPRDRESKQFMEISDKIYAYLKE